MFLIIFIRGVYQRYICTHTYMCVYMCIKRNTHTSFLSLPFCFSSISFWHQSLSAAMDCETNFYHYTLQVKEGSWEYVIYARFDFYVGSTGSSIIVLQGTLVLRAPDEML